MPTALVNDVSIYYETIGSGEPIIFLHGLGSCGADWLLQMPHFVAHYQVITPDLRGHGKSDVTCDSFAIAELAKDIALLMEHLGIASAHIVGLSLGSFVAIELALDFPSKVKSLTLAGSTYRVRDIGHLGLYVRKILLQICPMSIVAKVIAWTCFPQKEQKMLRKMCEARMASNDKRAYKELFREIVTFDVQKRLSNLTCPILIIAGGRDRLLPSQHAMKLKEELPHARLQIIPEAGHVMPIDSPQPFNDLLEAFLMNLSQ